MVKVSVILPVYNVEKDLENCLNSILNQSFKDFELIMVDDGSKDRSGIICDSYAKIDGRIKLIHQENMGLSMARNNGIDIAKGEYIIFIDSDDSIDRHTIQILYDNLVENDADISVGDYEAIYESGKIEDEEKENNISILSNIEAVNKILDKNSIKMIVAWCKLYRRELFETIRYPKGKYHEDEFVTYKLLYKAERIVETDAKLYYYNQRDESITGSKYSLKRLEKLEGLKEAIDFFKIEAEEDLEKKARVRYLLNIQIAYYRVKYEMEERDLVLENLKKEYHREYKILLESDNKTSIFNKIKLKFFYIAPDVYCFLVKLVISDRLHN